jgi:hypothetical protein
LYKKADYGTNTILNKELKYTQRYSFGPFTHIYGPQVENKNIVNDTVVSGSETIAGPFTTNITEKLKLGGSVCIIGYGASGTGKTSALIYLKPTKQDGILMELSNELGRTTYNK